jgi:hypothetical protein
VQNTGFTDLTHILNHKLNEPCPTAQHLNTNNTAPFLCMTCAENIWNKLPDLVDFCITKGIPQVFAVAKSCFDLSSNHSSVLIIQTAHVLKQEKQSSLSNRQTNWDDFRPLYKTILEPI